MRYAQRHNAATEWLRHLSQFCWLLKQLLVRLMEKLQRSHWHLLTSHQEYEMSLVFWVKGWVMSSGPGKSSSLPAIERKLPGDDSHCLQSPSRLWDLHWDCLHLVKITDAASFGMWSGWSGSEHCLFLTSQFFWKAKSRIACCSKCYMIKSCNV